MNEGSFPVAEIYLRVALNTVRGNRAGWRDWVEPVLFFSEQMSIRTMRRRWHRYE